MPRKPRIPKTRRSVSVLTRELADQLSNKGGFFCLESELLPEEDLRAGWHLHREEVLRRQRPGYRPWAYWRWEAADRPLSIYAAAGDPLFSETEAGCLERIGELTAEEARLLDMDPEQAEDDTERIRLRMAGGLERWHDQRFWHEELHAVSRFLVAEAGEEELCLPPGEPWVLTRGRLIGRLKAEDAYSTALATCEACTLERGEHEDVFGAAVWLARHWRKAHR